MDRFRPILVVDDDPLDRELIQTAFERAQVVNPVVFVADGVQALDYLHRRGAFADRPAECPAFVLLDVKMPRMSGLEVLLEIRRSRRLCRVPVVMFSASAFPQEIDDSYLFGANAYVVKPLRYADYMAAIEGTSAFWSKRNEPAPA